MTRYQSHTEPTMRDGTPLLTINQLILLNALRDFPDAQAPSHNAWLVAAYPYARIAGRTPNQWGLRRSMRKCGSAWVTRARKGHATTVTLTAWAIAILDRTIAARVRGIGIYQGLHVISRSAPGWL